MGILVVKALRWGNSYALRIAKRDFERLGLHEGQELGVEITDRSTPVHVPWTTFHSGHSDTSIRHDEVLYGGADR